jgi:hypothetical protein
LHFVVVLDGVGVVLALVCVADSCLLLMASVSASMPGQGFASFDVVGHHGGCCWETCVFGFVELSAYNLEETFTAQQTNTPGTS